MPPTPTSSRRELIEWFKGSGLLVVTLAGIFLYIVFSVPATIFYTRLGTTPSEVGITYTSLLSGSTLGALIVLAAVIILVVYFAFSVTYAATFLWASQMSRLVVKSRLGIRPRRRELTDQEFARWIELMEAFYNTFADKQNESGADWGQLESTVRRMRELELLGVRTEDEASEYESLRSFWNSSLPVPLDFIKRRIRPWGSFRRILLPLLIVIIVLPIIAFFQAGDVLAGRSYPGSQWGTFDYHAEPVTITPSADSAAASIGKLADEQLFLLGQNAQYVVLYAPKSRSTVRIPVTQIIVTSRPLSSW